MSEERVVLLDVGGVLFPDPWETLLLTSPLAQLLGVSPDELQRVGESLWCEIATHPGRELEWWWARVEERMGCEIQPEHIEEAAQLLVPVADAAEFLDTVHSLGRVGVISNSTAFWWPLQQQLLAWAPVPELSFLSHERGLEKSQGLFELAATEITSPALVVDDRAHNIDRARAVGLAALHHPPLAPLAPTLQGVRQWHQAAS